MNPDLEEFKILWKSYLKGQFTSLEDILLSIKHKEQEISDKLDIFPELEKWHSKKNRFYEIRDEWANIIKKRNLEIYHLKKKLDSFEDIEMKYEELRKHYLLAFRDLEQKYQTLKSGLEELLKQSPSIDFIRKDNVKELLERINELS